jgi:Sec-independent protein translocase protein TatA
MFGIGSEELVVIGLLFLVVFGPGKAVSMAKDLGRFVNSARGQVEEFKDELLHHDEDSDEDRDELASDSPGSEDEYEQPVPEKGSLP